jgi:UDP-N-acetylmuramoylalanine-D-glutamate ligase
VIGVTGSVGKTTGVALIQSILEKGLSCGRIYSKRLTPLTLSSWLVNFLDSSHRVLALEYSMYRKDHIDRLTDILTPDIGVFLNVKRMHLGVQGINSLQDIVEGKEALVRKSKLGVLNIDEPLVSQLKRHGDLTFSLRDKQADAFIFTDGDEAVLILNSTGHEIRFVPYIKTSLFYYQASVAGLIGVQFGISPELITNALEDFRPAENRINWIDVKGHQVLFDGDVTVSGRMASLSEHHYTTSILMIHSFDFGEENIDLQVDDFSQVFSTFSEVRVLDTEENRTIISKYSLRNIIFVTKDDFLSGLSKFEFKVLHFGTYFRKYKDLSFLMQFIAV